MYTLKLVYNKFNKILIKAKKHYKSYEISRSDELWIKKIMDSGTFKDKVSALSIYIRDNPKFSLKTLENLILMCNNKSKRESLTAINAVKDIFNEVLIN